MYTTSHTWMHTYIQAHIYIHINTNTHTYSIYYICVYVCICVLCTHTRMHPNDLNLELVCFTDSGLYHCALHCQTPTVLACSICLQAHILPRSFCHSLLISLSLDITFSMRPFLTPKTPATPRLLSDETQSWSIVSMLVTSTRLTLPLIPSTYGVPVSLKGWCLSSSLSPHPSLAQWLLQTMPSG